jgi:hypothetical protein
MALPCRGGWGLVRWVGWPLHASTCKHSFWGSSLRSAHSTIANLKLCAPMGLQLSLCVCGGGGGSKPQALPNKCSFAGATAMRNALASAFAS